MCISYISLAFILCDEEPIDPCDIVSLLPDGFTGERPLRESRSTWARAPNLPAVPARRQMGLGSCQRAGVEGTTQSVPREAVRMFSTCTRRPHGLRKAARIMLAAFVVTTFVLLPRAQSRSAVASSPAVITTLATGLDSPCGLKFGPDGDL